MLPLLGEPTASSQASTLELAPGRRGAWERKNGPIRNESTICLLSLLLIIPEIWLGYEQEGRLLIHSLKRHKDPADPARADDQVCFRKMDMKPDRFELVS